MFCYEWRQTGGGGASELTTHIHNSRNGTCRAAADVGAHRPECALRKIKSAGASGEYYARQPGIADVGSQSDKDSRDQSSCAGCKATSDMFAVLASQTVADPTSQK